MADKTLRWFLEGRARVRTEAGGTFRMDGDYTPESVRIGLKVACVGDNPTKIDITADGVSIFDSGNEPAITNSQSEKVWTTIPTTVIREGAIMRLNVPQVAETDPGEDMTVELALVA
jgi:hypothetical protein